MTGFVREQQSRAGVPARLLLLLVALSSSEDVAAIGITWLATQHPWAAASITLALLLASVVMVRWVIKALRGLWERLRPAPAT